jgi:hypothetical protein
MIMKATSATIGREKDTKPGTRTSTTVLIPEYL